MDIRESIYLLEAEIRDKKNAKANDKKKWIVGIVGVILSCLLLGAMNDIFFDKRADTVTQVFIVLGMAGVGLVVYALRIEQNQENYIAMLERELREQQTLLRHNGKI